MRLEPQAAIIFSMKSITFGVKSIIFSMKSISFSMKSIAFGVKYGQSARNLSGNRAFLGWGRQRSHHEVC